MQCSDYISSSCWPKNVFVKDARKFDELVVITDKKNWSKKNEIYITKPKVKFFVFFWVENVVISVCPDFWLGQSTCYGAVFWI